VAELFWCIGRKTIWEPGNTAGITQVISTDRFSFTDKTPDFISKFYAILIYIVI
jgi:hypothetical protein